MKQMEVTDELLYQYMPIADEMDLDALEAEIADEEIVLSKKFERRMKRLMWKEEHKWVAGFGKFMARVAVVLLCVLGVSLAVTMSVDAYRSKFFQTVQEIWEDSVVHTYDVGEEGQEFVPHEPSYIPEGYEEVRRIENANAISIEYVNQNGDYINYEQRIINESDWQTMSLEYQSKEVVRIEQGVLTISIYDSDYKQAYLENNQYICLMSVSNMSNEEIVKIMQNIK